MPSPIWSAAPEVPIAAAIAAATHAAWEAPKREAPTVFLDTLRKLVGPERLQRIERDAVALFLLQPRAPEGYDVPPEWAWFTICPGCQTLRRTKFSAAPHGRVKLEVLRDRDWLGEQLARGRTYEQLAEQLGCSAATIQGWVHRHGLKPPRTLRSEEIEREVRRLHLASEGLGTISRNVDISVQQVRRALERLGLASAKHGQVYMEAEWWRVRLQDRGLTLRAAAREAGIRPHHGTWYVKKFGLQHLVRHKQGQGRPRKYPVLYDEAQLRDLLARHTTYQSAAAEVGCSPSRVSGAARALLGAPLRAYPRQLPHSARAWWEERVARGITTWEMAEEAGLREEYAREKLRVLGLLAEAYANSTRHEREQRARRRSAA